MTTSALPSPTTQQRGIELLVSRLAIGLLRWSQNRTAQRRPTHEEMMLLRRNRAESANALDLARLSHLG